MIIPHIPSLHYLVKYFNKILYMIKILGRHLKLTESCHLRSRNRNINDKK